MTNRARPSEADLRARLREGHFTAATPLEAITTDPVTPTPMVVAVEDIVNYDRNPRQTPNPAFAAIQASIRDDGLHQPLVITRRPGNEHYMVLRGGNTRLRAIQALYRETGDPRFHAIHCLFEPWSGESVALLGHLIENDTRGDLTFLDRARAIDGLKTLLQEELDAELSQRRLAAILKDRGYRISPILISQMAYALSELAPLLPRAFGAGLGGDRVQRIRALDHAGEAVWQHGKLGEPENYRALFRESLACSDAPNWRFAVARKTFVKRLAAEVGAEVNGIEAMLDTEMASPSPSKNAVASNSLNTVTAPPPMAEAATADDAEPSTSDNVIKSMVQPTRLPTMSDGGPVSRAETPADDLKSLRARAWTLAVKLARRYHIDPLIHPLPQNGLGYSVTEVIDPSILTGRDKTKTGEIGTLWWHLVACAELTSAPTDVLPSLLKADGTLLQALREGDLARLLDAVPTYHVSQLAAALWARMDEPGWHDLVALMETHRRLRRTAAHKCVSLWAGEDVA